MKITMDNGMVFEGTQAEYEAFLAFAERKLAEQEAKESEVSALNGEKIEDDTVKAEFTEGDNVKILGLSKYGADEVGKVGVVEDEANLLGEVYVRVEGRGRYYKTDKLELESEAEETIDFEGSTYHKVEREACEGDIVIFKHGIYHVAWITKGKAYKAFVNGSNGIVKVTGDDGDNIRVYESDYRNRTRETVDVYESKYVPQEGDIVVITDNPNDSPNKVGDIGKVIAVWNDNEDAQIHVPDERKYAYCSYFADVRKATPAEVEKYEHAAKVAEIAKKWAKIGRKPNEFKKGDVVRFTSKSNPNITGLNTVTHVEEDRVFYDSTRQGNSEEYSSLSEGVLSLVSPVESLFSDNA